MNHQIRSHQGSAVLIGFASLAVLAGLILNTGCASAPGRVASAKFSCCTNELTAAIPLPDKSLYQLDSSWTNDTRAALKLMALRGRPLILTMFFTRCQYACPILVHDMKQIEAALPADVRTNVGFVLVSFDSERDTPAALAGYRKDHKLAANWTLLRGAPDDVLELAALLGVKFKRDLRGDFAHSNVITVLDANGEIVSQQLGLNHDAAPTAAALQKLVDAGQAVKK